MACRSITGIYTNHLKNRLFDLRESAIVNGLVLSQYNPIYDRRFPGLWRGQKADSSGGLCINRQFPSLLFRRGVSSLSDRTVLVKAIIEENNPLFQKWEPLSEPFVVVRDEVSTFGSNSGRLRYIDIRSKYSEIHKYIEPKKFFDSVQVWQLDSPRLCKELIRVLEIPSASDLDLRIRATLFWGSCAEIDEKGFSEKFPCPIKGEIEKRVEVGGAFIFGSGPGHEYTIRTTPKSVWEYMGLDTTKQFFEKIELDEIIATKK